MFLSSNCFLNISTNTQKKAKLDLWEDVAIIQLSYNSVLFFGCLAQLV